MGYKYVRERWILSPLYMDKLTVSGFTCGSGGGGGSGGVSGDGGGISSGGDGGGGGGRSVIGGEGGGGGGGVSGIDSSGGSGSREYRRGVCGRRSHLKGQDRRPFV